MKHSQDRKIYRIGYDPVYWYNRSCSILEEVEKSECLSWLNHPCTQALLGQIQSSVAHKVKGWLGGVYAEEDSVDATAIKQAKAIGQAQACDEIIDIITEIGNYKFGEESTNGD